MFNQTFILSTGRCGTQWLATQFGNHYGDLLKVEHEPQAYDSFSNRVPADGNGWLVETGNDEVFQAHLERIEETSLRTSYLECGFPAWKVIAKVTERFQATARIVHLTRHPVPTAYSWMSKGAYVPPLLPHMTEREMTTPFLDGVRHPDYRDRWKQMTPYEKNLYNWLELNACALDYETICPLPWLRLGYEELFFGNGLVKLIDFLDLPMRQSMRESLQEQVDRYRALPVFTDDPALIHAHEDVCAMAGRLGYDVDDYDISAFRARFFPGPGQG